MKPSAESTVFDPKAELRRESPRTRALAVVFAVACLFLSPLGTRVLGEMGPSIEGLGVIWSGVLLGQVLLLNIIGGLAGRHWLFGFSASIGLALLGTFSFILFFSDMVSDSGPGPEILQFLCCLPLALGIACLPYFLFRIFRKWRIASSDSPPAAIHIEDFLVTMALLGCLIALVRAGISLGISSALAQEFDMSTFVAQSFVGFCFYLGVLFFVLNMISIPAVVFAFRPEPFALRAFYIGGYSIIVWVLFSIVLAVFAGSGASEAIGYLMLNMLFVATTATLGIESLRIAGYNLWSKRDDRRRLKALSDADMRPEESLRTESTVSQSSFEPVGVVDPLADNAEELAESRQKRAKKVIDHQQFLARWLTAGWIAVTALLTLISIARQPDRSFEANELPATLSLEQEVVQ